MKCRKPLFYTTLNAFKASTGGHVFPALDVLLDHIKYEPDYDGVFEGGNAKLLTGLLEKTFASREVEVAYVCTHPFYDV